MRIAVVGGTLLGVEIAYLAGETGFVTVLFDRNDNVPACGICDDFTLFHFKKERGLVP